jgi:hypothetical protein
MSQMGLCRCTVFSNLLIFLSYIARRSNVISLFDMLLATGGGVWELDVALVVCPVRWFFCFLGRILPFCSLYSPLLGALVYL